jgi:hypothetical protein
MVTITPESCGLGLRGIQIPEKYKQNFDVSREGPSFTSTVAAIFHMKALSSKRRSFACIFQVFFMHIQFYINRDLLKVPMTRNFTPKVYGCIV